MSIKGMISRSTRHPVEKTGARREGLYRSWPGRDFFMGLFPASTKSVILVGYFLTYTNFRLLQQRGVTGYGKPALLLPFLDFGFRFSPSSYPGKYSPEGCLVSFDHEPGGFGVSFFLPACGCSSLCKCLICGLGTAGYIKRPRRLSPTVIYGSSSIVLAVSWTKIIGSRAGGLFRPSPCPLLLFIYKSLALVSILRPHWIIAGKKVSACRFLGLRGDQGRSSLNPFTFRRF